MEGWSKQGAAVTRQHSSGLLLVLSCQGGTLDSGMSGVLWGVPVGKEGPWYGVLGVRACAVVPRLREQQEKAARMQKEAAAAKERLRREMEKKEVSD